MDLSQLAQSSLGALRIDGGAPVGKGFVCRRGERSHVIITAAHVAGAYPVKHGALCDLASGAPIAEGPALLSPWGPPTAPAQDVLVFATTAPPAGPAFAIADHDPVELQTVHVITDLRGRPDRGRIHRGTVVKVFPEGALVVDLDDGLTPEEARACSGAPIVDERGFVVGMATGVLEHAGKHVLTGASAAPLRRSLPVAPQVITVEDSGDDIALRSVFAFLIAGAVAGAAFFLHASYEYDPWYPRGLRRFINQNEVLFIGGLFVLSFVAVFWMFQRRAKRKRAAGR